MYEITSGVVSSAQKVVIYGPEGIGKSTFAAQFPDPVFIDTEGSTKKLNIRRFPKPSSWEMLKNEVKEAMNGRLCKTLVIDTFDWAEQLCIETICSAHQKKGIEDFGYGNGYVYEKEEIGKFLNLLQEVVDSGINVVLTAHAQMRKFEQPDELGAYDRWELKLGKKTSSQISPLVKEWADMVLFANYKTYAVAVDKDGKKFKAQGGDRVMYTTHHPCWDAKNRDGLPSEMPFEYSGIAHLFAYTQPAEMPKPVPMPRRVQEQLAQPKAAPQPPHKTSNAVTLQQAQPTAAPKAEEPLTDLSGFEDVAPPPIVIPEGIPKALADLMRANNVSESDIRLVVSQRNYFPYDTPITNYPDDFVQGCLIGAWEQMLPLIRENQKVPFKRRTTLWIILWNTAGKMR